MTKEAISALANLLVMPNNKKAIEEGRGADQLDTWIAQYEQLQGAKGLDDQDIAAARKALNMTVVADVGKALDKYKKKRYPTFRIGWGGGREGGHKQ